MTLAELAGTDPSSIAIEDAARSITWAELDDLTLRFAHGLHSLGAVAGTHVTLQAGNRIEFLLAAIGSWRAGCSYTPVKTGWTATEVAVVVDEADSRVIVADRPGAREVAQKSSIPLLDLDGDTDGWLAHQSTDPIADEVCGFKLPFTSGTTGRPKGVIPATAGTQTFSQSWKGLAAYAEMLRLPGDGVHLFATRLFNGAPLTFGLGALCRGATIRILPGWDPASGLDALCRSDVTSTILVPTMFRQLLSLGRRSQRPGPRLKTILHGGEPCPIPVKQAMIDWFGPILVEFYGFTEGGMSIVDSTDWVKRPGTVGKPMAGLEVTIRDEHGNELPAREEGTICFAQANGQRRFRYLGDDDKTERAHQSSAGAPASFTVGDIGWKDDDGYVYISGRVADVAIVGGVNVYPAEIDEALSDVPGITDLCAVGALDEIRGERIVLVVTIGAGDDEATVRRLLTEAATERLAPYKRPTEVVVTDQLPRDETGKLLRAVVRDQMKGSTHAARR